MIIDATDMILGRLASHVAKHALLGEKVDIVNCEKAVLSGSKANVLAKFNQKVKRGIPLKGPYYPKMPDRIVRRTIRGMLPYKQEKGRVAYKRVMCYIGIPEEFKDAKLETIPTANISKCPTLKFVKVETVSKFLGAKI